MLSLMRYNMSAKNGEIKYTVSMFKKYRNLLGELTRKNVKLKYRNSWLGILWSFIQPLLYMVVLSVVFGGIFGTERKDIVCFPVYLFTGRLLFSFFTTSTKQAMTSFRRNQAIIKKVYVPKYMYPLSSILSNFINFAISLLCLIFVWIFFKTTGIAGGGALHINGYVLLCWVPMLILLIFCTGVGLILSVISVYFRDIEYIWEVLCQLLFYMVPIIYHLNRIIKSHPPINYVVNIGGKPLMFFNHPIIIEDHPMVMIIKLNPLYSMIELFRQCVLYHQIMSTSMLLYAAVFSFITLFVGIWFFNKKSDDIIFHL